MKTPLTRERIRQHLLYSSWKYVLSAILIVVSVNLLFTTTAYRSPADKVCDVYTYGVYDTEQLAAYVKGIHETEMTDMEQMEAQTVMADETYGSMLLMTRFAAGEGSIYILPKAEFQSYAGEGAFAALDTIEGMTDLFDAYGINLERGLYRNTETGERHIYGIPVSCMEGMKELLGVSSEYYVCLVNSDITRENGARLMRCMIRDLVRQPAADTAPAAEAPAASTDTAEASAQ